MAFKMTNPFKQTEKKEEKLIETRGDNWVKKSKGGRSSTYKVDHAKTKENKDGSKTYTYTNDAGASITEVHSSI